MSSSRKSIYKCRYVRLLRLHIPAVHQLALVAEVHRREREGCVEGAVFADTCAACLHLLCGGLRPGGPGVHAAAGVSLAIWENR